MYNSETDNLENKINNNYQCQSCKKTATNGKANYFDKAYKVEADFKDSARPWDGEISLPKTNLTKGDKLVLVFWTKGDLSSDINAGALQIYLSKPANFWIKKPSDKALIPMNNSWQQWRIPIEIQGNKFADSGNFQAKLRFGLLSQKFEIGGVALIKYNNSADIERARLDASKTYEGMDEGASWRNEALNRINKVRKSNLNITVKDSNGNPVSNANVMVEQQGHQFDFGVGQQGRILAPGSHGVDFKDIRKKIIDNCNTLGLGSDLL